MRKEHNRKTLWFRNVVVMHSVIDAVYKQKFLLMFLVIYHTWLIVIPVTLQIFGLWLPFPLPCIVGSSGYGLCRFHYIHAYVCHMKNYDQFTFTLGDFLFFEIFYKKLKYGLSI